MRSLETNFSGLFVIQPTVYEDPRGFFCESYNKKALAENGIHAEFVQDNFSYSKKDTLRGLHYQSWPCGQGKLVSCSKGSIWDVAVDLRPDSETFLKYYSIVLSGENKTQIYIPNGYAHGFVVLSEDAEVRYKCTWYYEPKYEKGYAWDDPTFDIQWPTTEPVLSERDKNNPRYY
jgi:dTDP-4-dehydrorhamnose 3,5-epimerase